MVCAHDDCTKLVFGTARNAVGLTAEVMDRAKVRGTERARVRRENISNAIVWKDEQVGVIHLMQRDGMAE